MGSIGTTTEASIQISNNRMRYADIKNLYRDLHGSIQYYAYEKPMRKLGTKNGVEYGIVGTNRVSNSRYNDTSGHIGYKIENDTIYITTFSPTTVAEASKFVREDIKDADAWIKLGRRR